MYLRFAMYEEKVELMIYVSVLKFAAGGYDDVKAMRVARVSEPPAQRVGRIRRRPEERLRARDPW